MAKNGYKVLDSDLHLMEPADLFERYMDPLLRERGPKATAKGAGHYARWTLDGSPVPPWAQDERIWKVNADRDRQAQEIMSEGWASNFDANTSLAAMDKEGIDIAIMFRTAASMFISKDSLEPQTSLAICRAFNNWVADYCKVNPKRLKGTSIVPQQDPELAAQEARRSVQELGSVGLVLLPMPIAGLHPHDREFDVLWREAESLGVPICFHGTSGAVSKEYVGSRFVGHPAYRTILHTTVFPIELMMTMSSMIMGGVLERFPKLRVAFLEGNCSWLPWWLYRMDDQWEKFGPGEDVNLSQSATEYFLRQCYISVDADESLVEDVVKRLGDENLVFSTDYPHPDSAYPHATEEILSIDGLSSESKKKILWDNCVRLYGLQRDVDIDEVAG